MLLGARDGLAEKAYFTRAPVDTVDKGLALID